MVAVRQLIMPRNPPIAYLLQLTVVSLVLLSGFPVQMQSQTSPQPQYHEVFENIRHELETGDVEALADRLDSQVQINLRGSESGMYSVHQAYYLLVEYFRLRRLTGLSFTTVAQSGSNPYATGAAGLTFKGTYDRVQVYVSLGSSRDRVVITRLSIY